MRLDINDKDYMMKFAVFMWLHNRKIRDINGHFKMRGIYMSSETLRMKLHRFVKKLNYQELSDIVESVDIPPEFVNTERILANKGFTKKETHNG